MIVRYLLVCLWDKFSIQTNSKHESTMYKPNNTHTPKKNNRLDRENWRANEENAEPTKANLFGKEERPSSRKRKGEPESAAKMQPSKVTKVDKSLAPYASAAAQRAVSAASKSKAGTKAITTSIVQAPTKTTVAPPKSVVAVPEAEASSKSLETLLSASLADNEHLTSTIEKLQAGRNRAEEALEKAKRENEETVERLEMEKKHEAAARRQAEDELAAARMKLKDLEESLSKRCTELAQEALAKQRAMEESIELRQELSLQQEACDSLQHRALQQEALRRELHETIQELKGNIRVFCRIRPSLASDPSTPSIIKTPAGSVEPTAVEVHAAELAERKNMSSNNASMKPTRFKFDHVFSETSSQEDVFKEIAPLTQSALDGFKVCIFAYGQTGSGKTFTMQGAFGEERGVVPRAAEQMFSHSRELGMLGWKFTFEASFLEIYNEELRDLLPHENSKGGAKEEKLRIVDDGSSVHVVGLRSAVVNDIEQLEKLMVASAKARSTASTKLNDHSSRSHYIFRMRVLGHHEQSGTHSDGELNLVDLAGSERVKESGVAGEAMREAQCINKSLSALGDVISSMTSKSKHIPFRNSKLTHMLANALSGSSKTLMFVNVSPLARHHAESISSLRFAAKAGGVEVGPAEKKVRKD